MIIKELIVNNIKLIVLSLTLISTFFNVSAQNIVDNRTDLEKENLRGYVRQISVYDVKKITYYDADELKKYQSQGVKPPTTERKLNIRVDYNAFGYITKSTSPKFDYGDNYSIKYIQNNKIKTKTIFNSDGSIKYTLNFNYDINGRCINATKTGRTKIFDEYYTYDEDGLLQIVENVNTSGLKETTTYSYIEGKLNRTISVNGNSQTIIIYNGSFTKPTETLIISNTGQDHVKITYDYNGNPTYIEKETSRKWNPYVLRTFDNYGNVTSEINYDANGEIKNSKQITYTYDSHGNWIKMTQKSSVNYMNYVKEREILYY